jgi:hypothetical protein
LLPVLALLVKVIVPRFAPLVALTKFCVIPELFVIPAPLMVRVNVGLAVIMNGSVSNTIPLTCVFAEMETAVVDGDWTETSNVAMSDTPLGTVFWSQLLAVFQSDVLGAKLHLALPPKVTLGAKTNSISAMEPKSRART